MEAQEDTLAHVVFVMKNGREFISDGKNLSDAERHLEAVRSHVEKHGFRGWRFECGYLLNMKDLSVVFCATKADEARNDAP